MTRRYGTKSCPSCLGFGIVLTLSELVKMMTRIEKGFYMKSHEPIEIQRVPDDVERCPTCKGTGWVFVIDHPHITFPTEVFKRR